ncbi:MAG: hypothetical protein PQ968_06365 [Methanobacterium sp.]|jgi:hypothetical protein
MIFISGYKAVENRRFSRPSKNLRFFGATEQSSVRQRKRKPTNTECSGPSEILRISGASKIKDFRRPQNRGFCGFSPASNTTCLKAVENLRFSGSQNSENFESRRTLRVRGIKHYVFERSILAYFCSDFKFQDNLPSYINLIIPVLVYSFN